MPTNEARQFTEKTVARARIARNTAPGRARRSRGSHTLRSAADITYIAKLSTPKTQSAVIFVRLKTSRVTVRRIATATSRPSSRTMRALTCSRSTSHALAVRTSSRSRLPAERCVAFDPHLEEQPAQEQTHHPQPG